MASSSTSNIYMTCGHQPRDSKRYAWCLETSQHSIDWKVRRSHGRSHDHCHCPSVQLCPPCPSSSLHLFVLHRSNLNQISPKVTRCHWNEFKLLSKWCFKQPQKAVWFVTWFHPMFLEEKRPAFWKNGLPANLPSGFSPVRGSSTSSVHGSCAVKIVQLFATVVLQLGSSNVFRALIVILVFANTAWSPANWRRFKRRKAGNGIKHGNLLRGFDSSAKLSMSTSKANHLREQRDHVNAYTLPITKKCASNFNQATMASTADLAASGSA